MVYRSRFQFRDLTIFSDLLHPWQCIASRMWQILFKHMPFRLPVYPRFFKLFRVLGVLRSYCVKEDVECTVIPCLGEPNYEL